MLGALRPAMFPMAGHLWTNSLTWHGHRWPVGKLGRLALHNWGAASLLFGKPEISGLHKYRRGHFRSTGQWHRT